MILRKIFSFGKFLVTTINTITTAALLPQFWFNWPFPDLRTGSAERQERTYEDKYSTFLWARIIARCPFLSLEHHVKTLTPTMESFLIHELTVEGM